jgi:hypothetical protein
MASTKTQMIESLRAAILAIPEIGSFRGFNGQFDDNQNHPLAFPCVLWEINEIPWVTMNDRKGGQVQYTTNAQMTFHIGVRSFGVDPNVDDEIFEWSDQVSAAIRSVTGNEFGRFQRIGESMDTSHDTVVDHQLIFRFGISDCLTFANSDAPKTATINTVQEIATFGDVNTLDAALNFAIDPTHGTDDPND